jgi:hypothetical protein
LGRLSRSRVGPDDPATQRLSGQDELANEVLQPLDLFGVPLANVLEVGFQTREGSCHLGYAGTVAAIGRRDTPDCPARDFPQAPARAS